MLDRLDRDISLGAMALFVLLLAGGIAVMYKANTNKASLGPLPPRHRPVPALPTGAASTIMAPHEFRGSCHFCHPVANVPPTLAIMAKSLPTKSSPGSGSIPAWLFRPPGRGVRRDDMWAQRLGAANRPWPGPLSDAAQAALQQRAADRGGAGLLTPAEQNASSKMMVEGHWLGMETMDLTPALKKIYSIPADVTGVIVDEITLESAESGILAGDVVTSIQGRQTRNLAEFLRATETVSAQKKAEVVVNRLGAEKRFTIVAKNTEILGFASVEGAQPIRPGALSPHRKRRGACTDCHVIMATGGQLPVDAGDILPSPPPITANATAPHAYRGVCNSCHVIKRG